MVWTRTHAPEGAVRNVATLGDTCAQAFESRDTPLAHAIGDTAHADSISIGIGNCLHHCKGLLLMKLDAPGAVAWHETQSIKDVGTPTLQPSIEARRGAC
jgi:hypothetical protein